MDMKKLTRRELFRRAGAVGIGGAALAVGLSPASKERWILAGSRVGKSFPGLYPEWSPTFYLPSGCPSWQGRLYDEALKEAGFLGARYTLE